MIIDILCYGVEYIRFEASLSVLSAWLIKCTLALREIKLAL